MNWKYLAVFLPATALAQSISFDADRDYERQLTIPGDFGAAEFTLEVDVLLDDSFPVGSCASGNTARNWCTEDNQPGSSSDWWYRGNFLLDGHNNRSFSDGTFSLQIYGAGRVRWLLGNGRTLEAVQAWPATETDSLLDGRWHRLTLIRRYSGSGATLELWVDGTLIDEEATAQVDLRRWFDNWDGFSSSERGWYWGAEKQAANGTVPEYEDFKGRVDNRRYYHRAKTPDEIASEWEGLVGIYRHREGAGGETCDILNPSDCTSLIGVEWSSQNSAETFAAVAAPPPPPPPPQCDDGLDNDGDGAIDLSDPGCDSATDDDETNAPAPPSETFTVDFESGFAAYGWIDFPGWRRDTGPFAGNSTATAYPTNFNRFPNETASFTFDDPQILVSLRIATLENGDFTLITDTEEATFSTRSNQQDTLVTEFTQPTRTVTVRYVGGNFGIDDIVSVRP